MILKQALSDFKGYQAIAYRNQIRLDANESDYQIFDMTPTLDFKNINRYPDNSYKELRNLIASYYHNHENQVLLGNGSSELIELIIKSLLNPNDLIFTFEPTFSMYAFYSKIHLAGYETYRLNSDFQLDVDGFIKEVQVRKPKLIILCNPNNPSGSIISKADILKIVKHTDAFVLVDEAYMEFSIVDATVAQEVSSNHNLLVIKTFSKAFGLAGIRLGYLMSNHETINALQKVRSPYYINMLSYQIGIKAFENIQVMLDFAKDVVKRREDYHKTLMELHIESIPTQTNFLWIKSPYKGFSKDLEKKNILIKSFNDSYCRITIGHHDDMVVCINNIKELMKDEPTQTI